MGWRIPFLISIALIGVGLFIRLRVMESPLFERVKETKAVAKAPFIELIRTYPKQIVLAIGTRFATDITFNVINVFMLAYGTQQLGLPRDLFLKAILIGCAVALITLPLFGKLSDVVGRRTVYMFGAVFVIIYGFVFFRLIETKEPNFIVLAYIGGIAFSQASTYAVQSTWFAEIAGIIASGPTPLISAWLFASYASTLPIALYVAATGLLSLVCAYFLRETFRDRLDEEFHG